MVRIAQGRFYSKARVRSLPLPFDKLKNDPEICFFTHALHRENFQPEVLKRGNIL